MTKHNSVPDVPDVPAISYSREKNESNLIFSKLFETSGTSGTSGTKLACPECGSPFLFLSRLSLKVCYLRKLFKQVTTVCKLLHWSVV